MHNKKIQKQFIELSHRSFLFICPMYRHLNRSFLACLSFTLYACCNSACASLCLSLDYQTLSFLHQPTFIRHPYSNILMPSSFFFFFSALFFVLLPFSNDFTYSQSVKYKYQTTQHRTFLRELVSICLIFYSLSFFVCVQVIDLVATVDIIRLDCLSIDLTVFCVFIVVH